MACKCVLITVEPLNNIHMYIRSNDFGLFRRLKNTTPISLVPMAEMCPFLGGCPFFRGSFNRGSTVFRYSSYALLANYQSLVVGPLVEAQETPSDQLHSEQHQQGPVDNVSISSYTENWPNTGQSRSTRCLFSPRIIK